MLMSHNTMGAFYSSVDNNNDKSGIYYSGVIGKLTKDSFEHVIRFNLYEDKTKCELSDIFDLPPKEEISIPTEWLDKVTNSSTQSWSGQGKGGVRFDKRGTGLGAKPTSSEWDKSWESYYGIGDDKVEDDLSLKWTPEMERDYIRSLMKGDQVQLKDGEIYVPGPNDPVDSGDISEVSVSPNYDYYFAQYGEDVAEAYENISGELEELAPADEVLQEIISQAYQLLSSEGQMKLATNGIR